MPTPSDAGTRRSLMQGWSAWVAVGILAVFIAVYTLFGSYIPKFGVGLGVGIICLLLVSGDCRRTSMNRFWWPLLALVTGVFGLWGYLLVRNMKGQRG